MTQKLVDDVQISVREFQVFPRTTYIAGANGIHRFLHLIIQARLRLDNVAP